MSSKPAPRFAAIVSAFALTLAAMGALPAPAEACRASRPAPAFSTEVLVDGRPLPEFAHEGTTYIEALKGREYEIRLRNGTGERVAVALAVDGLNSIDAKHTTARVARKWILAPWETITLSGWQTGSGTARRFVFTSEGASYGAWLGRTSDLGVISAAFFREARAPEPAMIAAPAPSAMAEKSAGNAPSKDELAATGIGREIEHRVVTVAFDEEEIPTASIGLRYEYHDALVRLGVLPASDGALTRRERARGFAEDGFAPDPFRGGR